MPFNIVGMEVAASGTAKEFMRERDLEGKDLIRVQTDRVVNIMRNRVNDGKCHAAMVVLEQEGSTLEVINDLEKPGWWTL